MFGQLLERHTPPGDRGAVGAEYALLIALIATLLFEVVALIGQATAANIGGALRIFGG